MRRPQLGSQFDTNQFTKIRSKVPLCSRISFRQQPHVFMVEGLELHVCPWETWRSSMELCNLPTSQQDCQGRYRIRISFSSVCESPARTVSQFFSIFLQRYS